METTRTPTSYRGRSFGVLLLVGTQFLVGVIHVVFGSWLLSVQQPVTLLGSTGSAANIYSTYTVIFSLLTLIFTMGIWLQKRWGLLGTAAVAVFIIIADSLSMLGLPSVPGIPKLAGFGEIPYSGLLLIYLLQPQTRNKYSIQN